MNLCRATLLSCAVAVLVAGAASARPHDFTPPALKGTPQFLISGHGWGHGVGMSQYGAEGFAQNGFTYDQILAHYYSGTQLGATPPKSIRVLLASAKSLTVSSAGTWKVKDATGTTTTLLPGKLTLRPDLNVKLPGDTTPTQLTGPLTFSATASYPLYFKKPYRGTFTVSSDGKMLTLVNTLGLESYLYGVVPSEMPSTWHDEALKAQAVAARSYALAVRKTGAAYDVYDDTRSQVYGGILAESPTATAAVDETAGQILTYNGQVAVTYFYSTSGGRTAAIADVWNTAPVPYLVSVDDPYDAISPYHDWGPLAFKAGVVQKALKVPGRPLDLQVALNASGRVSQVTAVGVNGEVTLTGTQVQSALKLRSTWFRVGVLALDPLPKTPLTYGTAWKLTGIGRNLSDLALESRATGDTEWTPVGPVQSDADGNVAIPFKSTSPIQYHLVSGGVASDPATLLVAPAVGVKVRANRTGVKGTVKPLLPGAALQIQRQGPDGKWRTIVPTTVAADGTYAATFHVFPATYRVRVAAGHHWAVALRKFVVS